MEEDDGALYSVTLEDPSGYRPTIHCAPWPMVSEWLRVQLERFSGLRSRGDRLSIVGFRKEAE